MYFSTKMMWKQLNWGGQIVRPGNQNKQISRPGYQIFIYLPSGQQPEQENKMIIFIVEASLKINALHSFVLIKL